MANSETPEITKLYTALRAGDLARVEALISGGIDINATAGDEQTPLLTSLNARQFGATKLLIELGADVNLPNRIGQTPMHMAAAHNEPSLVELLGAKGADVKAKDQAGRGPMHYAAMNNSTKVIDPLLLLGETFCGKSELPSDSPLHLAAIQGDSVIEFVTKSLRRGAHHGIKGSTGQTPLHDAARRGQNRMCALLVGSGADVNARTDFDKTPLHEAAASNRIDTCILLLEAGADPNAHYLSTRKPLECTTSYGVQLVIRAWGGCGEREFLDPPNAEQMMIACAQSGQADRLLKMLHQEGLTKEKDLLCELTEQARPLGHDNVIAALQALTVRNQLMSVRTPAAIKASV